MRRCKMVETHPPIPGVTVRRRLAVGGMGELFLGEEVLPDGSARAVVVKRLLAATDAEHASLLGREGDALAALDSPHIVRLYRRGPGWLLLEHVDGLDLGSLLARRARRGRPLPLGAAMAVVVGLARALKALHGAAGPDGRPLGLVHRDVSPGNVLIGRDGAVKLADLGVVRTAATDAATVAGVKGTLAYMAPEQLHGRPAGPSADLYGAGLVAYEALTGVPARPAGALGVAELVAARARLPAPMRALRPELPAALEAAVFAALAPEAAARPPSAARWLEALLAAGVAPDAIALAEAVKGAAPAEVRPARAPTAPGMPAAAAARRRPALVLILGFGALGALVVVLVLAFEPAEAPVGPAGRVSQEDAGAATLADVGPELAAGAALEPDVAGPLAAGGADADDADPDAADTAGEDLAQARLDAAAVAAEDARPAPHRERPPARAPARPDALGPGAATLALAITEGGLGPVYVSGAGASGLAPRPVAGLAADAAQLLRLRGGSPSFEVRLRLARRGEHAVATVGAPPGTFYQARCGGVAGPTPLVGLAVPATGLRCEVDGPAGARLGFTVREAASP